MTDIAERYGDLVEQRRVIGGNLDAYSAEQVLAERKIPRWHSAPPQDFIGQRMF